MNALTLLKQEHDQVKRFLEEGESTTELGAKQRTVLYERLKEMLTTHERMEEEVLYPALRNIPRARQITMESYQEHHVVDLIFEELDATPVDDERWAATFSVARDNIEHPIEEEEGEMFRDAREIFPPEELERMGQRMAEIRSLAHHVDASDLQVALVS